jgi:2-C-methyl-D-erythritol 4-phosphate cytidylyltransferase
MRIGVIIAAAGRSERFGTSDKLGQDLGGRPLLLRAVEPFTKHDAVGPIVVAGPADEEELSAFRDRFGPTLSFHGATVVAGGRTARWESIQAALPHVPDDCTHVAVHDAARPALSLRLLERLIEAAGRSDAVVPGVSIHDTVKRVGEAEDDLSADEDVVADAILGEAGRARIHGRAVEATEDRSRLVAVQTPQIFAIDLLRRAYAAGDLEGVTDDASAVERLGETVHVIEGESANIKVTTPDDIDLVRKILGVRPPKERPSHLRF